MQGMWYDLCEAETLSDARYVVLSSLPQWVPWAGACVCFVTYAAFIRVKLFLARWRRAARKRVERKFVDFSRCPRCDTPPPRTVIKQIEDGGDGVEADAGSDAEGNGGDNESTNTVLSLEDIVEFRSSVGLHTPRDNDLLVLIEEMLLVDEVPAGWVLYRTTSGVVRFMNLNTQELCLFPPQKQDKEQYVRKELRRRNRLDVERGFSISYNDRWGLNEQSEGDSGCTEQFSNNVGISKTSGKVSLPQRGCSSGTTHGAWDDSDSVFGEDVLGFSCEEDPCDVGEQSAFRRVFRYFLEREKKRIERDVEIQFWNCGHNSSIVDKGDSVANGKADCDGLRSFLVKRSSMQSVRDAVSRVSGGD